MASSISFRVAIPVDIIIVFFLEAIYLISLTSVISKEAILYSWQFKLSNKSTALILNGLLNNILLYFFAKSKASLCQLNGVQAFLYRLYKLLFLHTPFLKRKFLLIFSDTISIGSYVCILIKSAPFIHADLICSNNFFLLPPWFPDISAIIFGG